MGEPKNPENTRPFPVKDPRETTRPIPNVPGGDRTEKTERVDRNETTEKTELVQPPPTEVTRQTMSVTRPTMSVTRPTAVFPKEALRPAPPASGTRPAVNPPAAAPAARRTGQVSRVTGQVSRVTGQIARVPSKALRTTASEAVRPDLMTEGMRARRREIDRKKRRAAIDRMRMEAELGEGWRRVWKTTGLIFLALALGYGYWRVQHAYGDEWPLMAVWLMMSAGILSGFAWILWYMNRGDA